MPADVELSRNLFDAVIDEEDEEAEEERRRQTQERNFDVFLALLPGLLKDHESEYALIVHAELRKVDADLEALIDYAYSKFPGAVALIQPIQKELPKSFVGGLLSRSAR
jgi:SHS2 domain-containing protein